MKEHACTFLNWLRIYIWELAIDFENEKFHFEHVFRALTVRVLHTIEANVHHNCLINRKTSWKIVWQYPIAFPLITWSQASGRLCSVVLFSTISTNRQQRKSNRLPEYYHEPHRSNPIHETFPLTPFMSRAKIQEIKGSSNCRCF